MTSERTYAQATIPDDLLRQALQFYSTYPDGQYDADVVVPLLRAELLRRAVFVDFVKAATMLGGDSK